MLEEIAVSRCVTGLQGWGGGRDWSGVTAPDLDPEDRTASGSRTPGNNSLCGHVQDDEFNSIAECNIQQGSNSVAHSMCHALGRVAQEACERDDGDGIHGKYHTGAHVGDEVDGDADGDKGQKDIDPAVEYDLSEDQSESLEDVWLLRPGICLFVLGRRASS